MAPEPQPLEQAYVAYLRANLTGVHVGTRVPTSRPAQLVRVTRAGGNTINLGLSEPRLLFECWGDTESTAWTLVRDCWQLVAASAETDTLPLGVVVTAADCAEPVNFPDVATGSPRYQFLATLTIGMD